MLLAIIKRSPILMLSMTVVGLIGCQPLSTTSLQQTTTLPPTKSNAKHSEKIVAKEKLPTRTSLPITKALLEQYHWQLVSALSHAYNDKGQLIKAPIGNFYHPDYPISVSFGSSRDSQTVHFSSNCNGSGATYTLLKDNTFRVDSIVSTDMGCGETGNRIENALFTLMNGSSSKLTLRLQPSDKPKTSADQNRYPRYNLLQTMESDDTLLWQNQEKESR